MHAQLVADTTVCRFLNTLMLSTKDDIFVSLKFHSHPCCYSSKKVMNNQA